MTELLYLSDSYLREFDASVLEVSEQGHVRLNRTAFYPGGGGQPFDCGTLAYPGHKYDVVGFVRKDNLIWHVIDGLDTLGVGQAVKGFGKATYSNKLI